MRRVFLLVLLLASAVLPASAVGATFLCDDVPARDRPTCEAQCKAAPASTWCLVARRFGRDGWPAALAVYEACKAERARLDADPTARAPSDERARLARIGVASGLTDDDAMALASWLEDEGYCPPPGAPEPTSQTGDREALREQLLGAGQGDGRSREREDERIRLTERLYGPHDPRTLDALLASAVAHLDAGDGVAGLARAELARARLAATVPPQHPLVLRVASVHGAALAVAGKEDAAVAALVALDRDAIARFGRVQGVRVDILNDLGRLSNRRDRPAAAEAAMVEALFVLDRLGPGPSGPRFDCLCTLGEARLRQGDAAGAREALREALTITTSVPIAPETTLRVLSVAVMAAGASDAVADARALYDAHHALLSDLRLPLGRRAAAVEDVANVFLRFGLTSHAVAVLEPLERELAASSDALALRVRALLALALTAGHQEAAARPLWRAVAEACRARAELAAFGDDGDPCVRAFAFTGDLDAASARLERLAPERRARGWIVLALTAARTDQDAALRLVRRAIEATAGEEGAAPSRLNDEAHAVLGVLQLHTGRPAEAAGHLRRLDERQHRDLPGRLAAARDDQERLEVVAASRQVFPMLLQALVGARDPRGALDLLLRWQGVGTRAEQALSAARDGEAATTLGAPRSRELCARLGERGAVLLAFASGSRALPAGRGHRFGEVEPTLYAVTVDPRGCRVRWRTLGAKADLEPLVGRWRGAIDAATDCFAKRGAAFCGAAFARVDQAGLALRDATLTPALGRGRDSRPLWLVADGPLAEVSFASLPDARGRYLVEDRAVGYLPYAAAALTTPRDRASAALAALVVGDVDYASAHPDDEALAAWTTCRDGACSAGAGALAAVAAVETRRGGRVCGYDARWGSLGETEARDVAERLSRIGRVALATGADATEAALKRALGRERVLHVATHGFFSDADRCQGGDHRDRISRAFGGGMRVVDDLALSALVLAGANGGDGDGRERRAERDGVLTARDITRLDLRATELVVLSACDTGRGAHRVSGEGVAGLGRAFLIGGAGAVVASSWSVPSDATRALMGRFYEALSPAAGHPLDPVAALRAAQLAALRDARAEGIGHSAFLWGAFNALSSGIPDAARSTTAAEARRGVTLQPPGAAR